MCPVCGGSSFQEVTWVSATKRTRRGFACVTCGARLTADKVVSGAGEGGARLIPSTLPAPPVMTPTEETSLRKPPADSGTFETTREARGKLKKTLG